MRRRRFFGHWSRRRVVRGLVALSLIAATAFLLLWCGSRLYDYNVDFYEPRDLEREGSAYP